MKYEIEKNKLNDVLSSMDELESLLNDRIVDLHEVKGGKQARHAFLYYRRLLLVARNNLINNIVEAQQEETK